MPDKKKKPAAHKCVKCGKVIKPDMKFTQAGKTYCCENCCGSDSKMVCEFC